MPTARDDYRLNQIDRKQEVLEQQGDRVLEMVGDLGNKLDVLAERLLQQRERADRHDAHHVRWEADHGTHVEKHEQRHRELEAPKKDVRWERRAAIIGLVIGTILAAAARYIPGGNP